MLVVVIVIIVIAGIWAIKTGTLEISITFNMPFNKGTYSSGNENSVIAVVNGEEIYKPEYKDRLTRATQQYKFQGVNIFGLDTIQLIKNEVISGLIKDKLLLQYAKKSNIAISDDKIMEIYNKDIEAYGGENNLINALDSLFLSQEEYKEIVRDQLTIDEYLRQSVDLSSVFVTEEEIQAGYNQAAQGVENAPLLEQARESIKQQLIQIKNQNIINEYLNGLLKESKIDLLL